MLRPSDDLAADDFWVRGGGNAIIGRVAARYHLASTKVPYDGNWWNTMSTTSDLVRYYAMLLDGSGGSAAGAGRHDPGQSGGLLATGRRRLPAAVRHS